jgi:hypothetical protein
LDQTSEGVTVAEERPQPEGNPFFAGLRAIDRGEKIDPTTATWIQAFQKGSATTRRLMVCHTKSGSFTAARSVD